MKRIFLSLFLFVVAIAIAALPGAWSQEKPAILEEDLSGAESGQAASNSIEESTGSKNITLLELFQKTGYFIYPLGAFSIWAVYLILANLFILSERRLVPVRVATQVQQHLARGDLTAAQETVEDRSDLYSLMVQAGLSKAGRDPGLIETSMEGSISREIASLRNRIRRLADIGNLAPMLGLLGTVWGMVIVFKEISVNSNAMLANWSSELADGVSLAMLTTVLGLVIGIPSLFFYYLFRSKMAKIVGRLESLGTDLADLLSMQRGAGGEAGDEETVLMRAPR